MLGLILSGSFIGFMHAQAAEPMMNVNMNNNGMEVMSSTKLMIGSQGNEVAILQSYLEAKGYLVMSKNTKPGYFGMATKMAVKRFQMKNGIPVTGKVDAKTKAKLSLAMKKDSGVVVGNAVMVRQRDIVDNAVRADNVTTVVAAVKAAGLVSTLKGEGPFTVFAPNNMAFEKLPKGTVEMLLMPENKAKLVDILTYHVVAGKYKMNDLKDGLSLTTVEGKKLMFTNVDGKLMINGSAMIETSNVMSSNGITHVIDSVLMP